MNEKTESGDYNYPTNSCLQVDINNHFITTLWSLVK